MAENSQAILPRTLFGRIQFVGSVRGWDDLLYAKLRDQFNELESTHKIPVKTTNWEHTAELAVWVIEDHNSEIQGTAFFLEGHGIITCAHCVGDNPFIYHPSDPTKKFSVASTSNRVRGANICRTATTDFSIDPAAR
jgi:hypothetical protein